MKKRKKYKSADTIHKSTAQRRLYAHIRCVLNIDIKRLKLKRAVEIFTTHYGIATNGDLVHWLYETYRNGTNKIICTASNYADKNRKKPKKLKSDIEILAAKASRLKNYHKFLQSQYWYEVRKLVLTRDGHKCRVCASVSNLEIHHDTYKHHFKEHKHLEDLMTLCRGCHGDYHMNIAKN